MAFLNYCEPNVNISTVWIDGSFSSCFLATVESCVLCGVMGLFGTFEVIMYCRFGSRVDVNIKEYRFFYSLQLFAMISLMLLPAVKVVLIATVIGTPENPVCGYDILYMLASLYVWLQSILMVRLERNYDLPTTPVHGHGFVLLIFWTLALMFDVLEMVDVSSKSWLNELDHPKTAILFSILVLHLICVIITFILGIKAPGIPTMQQRYLTTYNTPQRRLFDRQNNQNYGSLTNETSSAAGVSADSVQLDIGMPASVELIEKHLQSGELQRQFEAIPRHKAGLKSTAASKPENRPKNRHLNILPYDVTRVILQESPEGRTYINASRVTVFYPSSDVARHYIATQAPLPETVGDFWQMVYENLSGVIVTLCNLTEKGTQACVQYWPNKNECIEHGKLVVTCTHESSAPSAYFAKKSYIIREFSVFNLETQQELSVTQFHCIMWSPDQNPSKRWAFKPGQLVDLIHDVRNFDGLSAGPDVIHCSNGIDRTGMYIMADLGVNLIENDQPVRPPDLLRQMRSQRPGMISRYADYEFACSAILASYQRNARKMGYPLLKGKY